MSKRNHAVRKISRLNGSIDFAHSPVSGRIAVTERFPKISVPLPGPAPGTRIRAWLVQAIQRLSKRLFRRRGTRRKLQLLEMQQLGEKRFVAIVRVGKQRFLIGGAATSVALLAEINTNGASINAAHPLGQESA
jgi:hypothetical protein